MVHTTLCSNNNCNYIDFEEHMGCGNNITCHNMLWQAITNVTRNAFDIPSLKNGTDTACTLLVSLVEDFNSKIKDLSLSQVSLPKSLLCLFQKYVYNKETVHTPEHMIESKIRLAALSEKLGIAHEGIRNSNFIQLIPQLNDKSLSDVILLKSSVEASNSTNKIIETMNDYNATDHFLKVHEPFYKIVALHELIRQIPEKAAKFKQMEGGQLKALPEINNVQFINTVKFVADQGTQLMKKYLSLNVDNNEELKAQLDNLDPEIKSYLDKLNDFKTAIFNNDTALEQKYEKMDLNKILYDEQLAFIQKVFGVGEIIAGTLLFFKSSNKWLKLVGVCTAVHGLWTSSR